MLIIHYLSHHLVHHFILAQPGPNDDAVKAFQPVCDITHGFVQNLLLLVLWQLQVNSNVSGQLTNKVTCNSQKLECNQVAVQEDGIAV